MKTFLADKDLNSLAKESESLKYYDELKLAGQAKLSSQLHRLSSVCIFP